MADGPCTISDSPPEHLRGDAADRPPAWRRFALGAALCAAALLLAAAPLVYFGPSVIDDAYITFRYARHLAGGSGFVYNVSEPPVLGTSTPLLTLLLAAGSRLGAPIPAAALGLSVCGAALALVCGTALLGTALGGARGERPVGALALAVAAWVAIMASSPEWILAALSGMETSLFAGLALAALAAAARRRPVLAGVAAGLAVLTRYDGWALVVLLAGWSVWQGVPGRRSGEDARRGVARRAWLAPLIAVAMQAPWALYALHAFGDYAPHSVEAKRLIHEQTFANSLLTQLRYFAGGLRSSMVGARVHPNLLAFFAAGLFFALRGVRPAALLVLGWGALCVAGFTAARILMQPWYLIPALTVYVWIACYGLGSVVASVDAHLARRHAPRRVRVLLFAGVLAAAALLVAIQARMVLRDSERWPQVRIAREKAYARAARIVQETGRPGDSVLVGEVGVLGYALPGFRVLDSSGINSPRILRIRQETAAARNPGDPAPPAPELGDPEWVRRVLRDLEPRYIVSIERLLWLGRLGAEPAFRSAYHPVGIVRNAPAPPVLILERVGGGENVSGEVDG